MCKIKTQNFTIILSKWKFDFVRKLWYNISVKRKEDILSRKESTWDSR